MAHRLLNTNIKKCHPERSEGSKEDSSLFELRMTGAAIIFLVLLLLGLACGEKPAAKPSGGTLKLGAPGGKPSTLNPIIMDRSISISLLQLIFNGLVRMNQNMMPEPDLAKSWDISEDGQYRIIIFSEDQCKLWVDNKLVLTNRKRRPHFLVKEKGLSQIYPTRGSLTAFQIAYSINPKATSQLFNPISTS